MYIQPVFVQQASNGYPQFRFVVVFTQGKDPRSASTVSDGLKQLFPSIGRTLDLAARRETPDDADVHRQPDGRAAPTPGHHRSSPDADAA